MALCDDCTGADVVLGCVGVAAAVDVVLGCVEVAAAVEGCWAVSRAAVEVAVPADCAWGPLVLVAVVVDAWVFRRADWRVWGVTPCSGAVEACVVAAGAGRAALGRVARCIVAFASRAVEKGVGEVTALVANGELRDPDELIVIFSV